MAGDLVIEEGDLEVLRPYERPVRQTAVGDRRDGGRLHLLRGWRE